MASHSGSRLAPSIFGERITHRNLTGSPVTASRKLNQASTVNTPAKCVIVR